MYLYQKTRLCSHPHPFEPFKSLHSLFPLSTYLDGSDKFGLLQEIGASVSPEILGNTVAGVAKLDEFTMSLNWSRVGDLHMLLIQVAVSVFPITWISFS